MYSPPPPIDDSQDAGGDLLQRHSVLAANEQQQQVYDEIYYLNDASFGRDSPQSNYEYTNYNLNVNINSLLNETSQYYVINELADNQSSTSSRSNYRDRSTPINRVNTSTPEPVYHELNETTSGGDGFKEARREEELYEVEEEIKIVDGRRVKVVKEIVTKRCRNNNPELDVYPTNDYRYSDAVSTSSDQSQTQPQVHHHHHYHHYEPYQQYQPSQPQSQSQSQPVSSLPQPTTEQQPQQIQLSSSLPYMQPQIFECKYLGKWPCHGLWGMNNVREPIDNLVANAKHLGSANDLQRLKVTINEKGIQIDPLSSLNTQRPIPTDERYFLPPNNMVFISVGNVSYAAQDSIYAKVFALIVVVDKDKIECLAFLCSSSEECRRMGLSMTAAFQAYAAYLKHVNKQSSQQQQQLTQQLSSKKVDQSDYVQTTYL